MFTTRSCKPAVHRYTLSFIANRMKAGTMSRTEIINDEQRAALQVKIHEWRKVASPVGPQHALWDMIADAEALLAGRRSILSAEDLLADKTR
ncbi:hypothetical protein [Jiella avicenniae]|uniref:Uncharacterized protein n=1 Tax=Jiella avicenniae TaxID=2907202 RepID=A0A9X1T5R4_9HYPH|nr:hypothetical protein [Jiella avicenniae]MCE7028495.1 hypothetical protein [Jiella avicenniae]